MARRRSKGERKRGKVPPPSEPTGTSGLARRLFTMAKNRLTTPSEGQQKSPSDYEQRDKPTYQPRESPITLSEPNSEELRRQEARQTLDEQFSTLKDEFSTALETILAYESVTPEDAEELKTESVTTEYIEEVEPKKTESVTTEYIEELKTVFASAKRMVNFARKHATYAKETGADINKLYYALIGGNERVIMFDKVLERYVDPSTTDQLKNITLSPERESQYRKQIETIGLIVTELERLQGFWKESKIPVYSLGKFERKDVWSNPEVNYDRQVRRLQGASEEFTKSVNVAAADYKEKHSRLYSSIDTLLKSASQHLEKAREVSIYIPSSDTTASAIIERAYGDSLELPNLSTRSDRFEALDNLASIVEKKQEERQTNLSDCCQQVIEANATVIQDQKKAAKEGNYLLKDEAAGFTTEATELWGRLRGTYQATVTNSSALLFNIANDIEGLAESLSSEPTMERLESGFAAFTLGKYQIDAARAELRGIVHEKLKPKEYDAQVARLDEVSSGLSGFLTATREAVTLFGDTEECLQASTGDLTARITEIQPAMQSFGVNSSNLVDIYKGAKKQLTDAETRLRAARQQVGHFRYEANDLMNILGSDQTQGKLKNGIKNLTNNYSSRIYAALEGISNQTKSLEEAYAEKARKFYELAVEHTTALRTTLTVDHSIREIQIMASYVTGLTRVLTPDTRIDITTLIENIQFLREQHELMPGIETSLNTITESVKSISQSTELIRVGNFSMAHDYVPNIQPYKTVSMEILRVRARIASLQVKGTREAYQGQVSDMEYEKKAANLVAAYQAQSKALGESVDLYLDKKNFRFDSIDFAEESEKIAKTIRDIDAIYEIGGVLKRNGFDVAEWEYNRDNMSELRELNREMQSLLSRGISSETLREIKSSLSTAHREAYKGLLNPSTFVSEMLKADSMLPSQESIELPEDSRFSAQLETLRTTFTELERRAREKIGENWREYRQR